MGIYMKAHGEQIDFPLLQRREAECSLIHGFWRKMLTAITYWTRRPNGFVAIGLHLLCSEGQKGIRKVLARKLSFRWIFSVRRFFSSLATDFSKSKNAEEIKCKLALFNLFFFLLRLTNGLFLRMPIE